MFDRKKTDEPRGWWTWLSNIAPPPPVVVRQRDPEKPRVTRQ